MKHQETPPQQQKNDGDDNNNNKSSNLVVFSSHAAARYIASLRCAETGLLGEQQQSAETAATINAWMDWAASDLELPAIVWFYPVVRFMPFHMKSYVWVYSFVVVLLLMCKILPHTVPCCFTFLPAPGLPSFCTPACLSREEERVRPPSHTLQRHVETLPFSSFHLALFCRSINFYTECILHMHTTTTHIQSCTAHTTILSRYEKAKADLRVALQMLNDHLKDREFLVGGGGGLPGQHPTNDGVTLADIVVVSTLLYPFKLVCDPAYLAPFPHVVRWFQSCVTRPEFHRVLGTVTLCQSELRCSSGGGSGDTASVATL
jgi:glutathione S-transferase